MTVTATYVGKHCKFPNFYANDKINTPQHTFFSHCPHRKSTTVTSDQVEKEKKIP